MVEKEGSGAMADSKLSELRKHSTTTNLSLFAIQGRQIPEK